PQPDAVPRLVVHGPREREPGAAQRPLVRVAAQPRDLGVVHASILARGPRPATASDRTVAAQMTRSAWRAPTPSTSSPSSGGAVSIATVENDVATATRGAAWAGSS